MPQDYEQRPPGALLAALEPLLSGAAVVALLLLPALRAGRAWPLPPLHAAAAAAWAALSLRAAAAGSPSPLARAAGIFLVRGPHGHPAGGGWALLALLLDTLFVLSTAGLGAVANAAFRLAAGATVGERPLGAAAADEDARPARMGGLSPAGAPLALGEASASAAAGGFGSGRRGAAVTPRRL